MTDGQRLILSRLVKTSRPEGVGGLDLSNTDAVKKEILDLKIIEHSVSGTTYSLTLGDVLSSGGKVLPIDEALKLVEKNENVVLGMGAILVNM